MTNPLPLSQHKNMPVLTIPNADDEEAIKEAKKDYRINAFFHNNESKETKKKATTHWEMSLLPSTHLNCEVSKDQAALLNECSYFETSLDSWIQSRRNNSK